MPIDETTHFKIIVPMYNNEKWVVRCIESVFQQQYANWQLIVCVEPSNDNTYKVVCKYLTEHPEHKWMLICNTTRKYVPKNHIDCIRQSEPANEDVIVLLDGDDRLYGDDVLSYLNLVYQDDIWITWGSYIFDHSTQKGKASQPITEQEYQGPRWWRYSHLKTFRYFLFKGIKDEDLRDTTTGDYYTVAGDMALMFPMVEMAGVKHSKYIDKVLYIYNLFSPYNDEKVNKEKGHRCNAELRNRPRYPEQTKEALCLL